MINFTNDKGLLPCPFCGSDRVEIKIQIDSDCYREWLAVICDKCGARIYSESFHSYLKDSPKLIADLTKDWNTRGGIEYAQPLTEIFVHWDFETGRVSANCVDRTITLSGDARTALRSITTNALDRVTVELTGYSMSQSTITSGVMIGGHVGIDSDKWLKFCEEFQQLDENGDDYHLNPFKR